MTKQKQTDKTTMAVLFQSSETTFIRVIYGNNQPFLSIYLDNNETNTSFGKYACLDLFFVCLSFVINSKICKKATKKCLSCLSAFVCLPVCLSVCLPVCLSVCMPACLSVCLSVCPFVCLSVCLSVRLLNRRFLTALT